MPDQFPIPVRRAGVACEMYVGASQSLAIDVTARFYRNGTQIGSVVLPANTAAYTVVWSAGFLTSNLVFSVGDVLTVDYTTSDSSTLTAGIVSAGLRWNIDQSGRATTATTGNLADPSNSAVVAAL